MTDLETFRRETRAWLEANCPADMRTPANDDDDRCWGGRNATFKSPGQKQWLDAMAARGWTAPEWPKEYGGGGLSKDEARILRGEMRAISARSPLDSFGIWMLGPALLKYGSEAQKQEHLPKIVRGEIRWCQGYSEPGAGSDLASLQTKAEDKGDHYLVNGQKIWTSYANKADWIFCLVRTNPTAKKHEGISFLLFDMATPGVTTKPILLISGKSPFCETFFSDVKVPKDNLVGEVDKGWDHREISADARARHDRRHGHDGRPPARPDRRRRRGPGERPPRRSAAARRHRALRHRRLGLPDDDGARGRSRQGEAGASGAVVHAEILRHGAEQAPPRASDGGRRIGRARMGERPLATTARPPRDWLRTKANSIEGGTSEVQLNIIAKRILELPGA